MKILFLSKCSPFQVGGAEVRTKEVARELAKQGHQVTILCAKMEISELAFREWEGVKIRCIKVLPDFLLKKFHYPHFFPLALAQLFLMFRFPFFLSRGGFDWVREDISPFPPSGLWALLKFPGKRRTAVVHNLPDTWQGWKRYYGKLYGIFGYLMERLLRKGWLEYDRILCPGKWFSEDLQKVPVLRPKVVYSPNGISREFFDSVDREPPPGGKFRLLCVGRLVEAKGHRVLLSALAPLGRPELELQILGDGPLKQELEALVEELGLRESVRFLKMVPLEKMPQIYREADLLVLPSTFEGAPIVLREAMASRLPVLVSDIRAIKEMIGDDGGGVFFSAGDSQDLARKIEWSVDHAAEIQVRANQAFQSALRYSWEETACTEIELGPISSNNPIDPVVHELASSKTANF